MQVDSLAGIHLSAERGWEQLAVDIFTDSTSTSKITGEEKGKALRPRSAIFRAVCDLGQLLNITVVRSLACPRFSAAYRVVPGRLRTLQILIL